MKEELEQLTKEQNEMRSLYDLPQSSFDQSLEGQNAGEDMHQSVLLSHSNMVLSTESGKYGQAISQTSEAERRGWLETLGA